MKVETDLLSLSVAWKGEYNMPVLKMDTKYILHLFLARVRIYYKRGSKTTVIDNVRKVQKETLSSWM